MHLICKKYTYNHVHIATSLQIILTELAGADGVRVLKDAPAPSAGLAHSVADLVSFLYSMTMMNGDDFNSEYTKSAYGAAEATVRRTNNPRHEAKRRRKRRRTTMRRQ